MQVLPNSPGPEATGSERRVLTLLRSVAWGGLSSRALSSLNLAEHAYQRWGEIDFLLVGERGLVVIEVKGGDVSCAGGKWRYEDRLGRIVTRSKSPMVQAKDAFFSLDKNYIAPRLGSSFSIGIPAGFCVVLAGMSRRQLQELLDGPEFPNALVAGREDLASAASFQKFLEGVSSYWSAKNQGRKQIAERDVKALVALLRPEFEVVKPLKLSRERVAAEMLSLTEEQYFVLDLWEGAERIFCSSPAGCGKTLLAVEMLRRAVASGTDARLLVGTQQLAAALRNCAADPKRVISFEEALAARSSGNLVPPAAVLLIDEGQQMLDERGLNTIDSMVEGGIARGRWAWFGDANFQSPDGDERSRPAADLLANAATVRPKLTKNCRNTPEIILATEMASGVPLGHAMVSGRGLHPEMTAIEGRNSLARLIAMQVGKWRDEDIPIDSITVLTDGPDAEQESFAAGALGGFPVRALGSLDGGENAVACAAVDSFRGLESGFLILCLTGNYLDDALSRKLYVGMTRGNFALSVFATKETLARIQARMADVLREQSMGGRNGR